MHFAEELTGKFRDDRAPIAAISISDPSHITCVGNDHGFEQVFARFVQAHGRMGDVLLAISTSGNSPNVRAAEVAKAQGVKVVALPARTVVTGPALRRGDPRTARATPIACKRYTSRRSMHTIISNEPWVNG